MTEKGNDLKYYNREGVEGKKGKERIKGGRMEEGEGAEHVEGCEIRAAAALTPHICSFIPLRSELGGAR